MEAQFQRFLKILCGSPVVPSLDFKMSKCDVMLLVQKNLVHFVVLQFFLLNPVLFKLLESLEVFFAIYHLRVRSVFAPQLGVDDAQLEAELRAIHKILLRQIFEILEQLQANFLIFNHQSLELGPFASIFYVEIFVDLCTCELPVELVSQCHGKIHPSGNPRFHPSF